MKSSDEFIRISEVANLLNISSATIRHWEKMGLVQFSRNDDNNYRKFQFEDLVALCDILLYRNLDLPLKIIKSNKTKEQLILSMNESVENIDNQIHYLMQIKENLEMKRSRINQYEKLKCRGIQIEKVAFKEIYEFHFNDKKSVETYIRDTSSAITIFNPRENTNTYGILQDHSEKEILRANDKEQKKYVTGLFWKNSEGNSNKEDFINYCKINHIEFGNFICQYITSFEEPNRGSYMFFKTWVETK